jgi:hypothetical protein
MEFTPAIITQLISGGGVLAFAALVYWQLVGFRAEMREHRKELEAHRNDENETRGRVIEMVGILTQLVEHQRKGEIREFIREEISGVHEAEDTPVETPGVIRKRTPPGGYLHAIAKPKKPGE